MITIGVLGPLTLSVAGTPVDLAGRRERAVLAVLATNAGTAVSVGRLADYLWDGEPPRTARKALQTAVSNIRSTVAAARNDTDDADDGGWLVTTESGYRLALGPGQVDLTQFEQLAAAGREQLRDGEVEAARDSLAAAMALWRGDVPAVLGDGVAAAAEDVRLRELRLRTVADRVDADLAAGHHTAVIAELTALCEQHPDRERCHRQLMLALYRDGRQADALAVFERFRAGLVERHGLDPSSDARDLAQRILADDPTLLAWGAPPGGAAGQDATAPRPTAAIPLPRRERLVGRDQDVAGIQQLLAEGPLVTLVGPGGVGKTSLAAEVAHRLAVDGMEVTWCSLGDVLQPDNLVPALATALAIRQRQGVAMREAIVQRLRTGETLLVVDNCEHLLDRAADLLAELVARCPELHVVATSREYLGLDHERVWSVEGLALPAHDQDPRTAPAVELFLDRAARSDPHAHVDDVVVASVVDICRALDGLPLALELAAARVRALPPAEIAQRLDARFDLLVGRRGGADRHRSLRAAVAWSHDLLGERQRQLLRRLGAFAGPFTTTAAVRVAALDDLDTGEVPALLADLVDKSMVVATGGPGVSRYRLLETIRVFAREQCVAAGEVEATDAAFLAHVRDDLADLDRRLTGPEEVAAADHVAQAFDNVRHAVALSQLRGDVDLLASILTGLSVYLRFRVSWEASTWFLDAAARLQDTTTGERSVAAEVLGMAAWGAWLGGDLDTASELAQRVRSSVGPADPSAVEAFAALGVVEMYRGDERCIATTTEALELAEGAGRTWLVAYLLGAGALAHAYQGAPDAAGALLDRQALAVSRLDNDTARAWWLYCSAEVSGDRDPQHTIDLARRAERLARRTGASVISNVARVTIVSVSSRHGAGAEAIEDFTELIRRCWQQGAWTHLYVAVHNLIELLCEQGADEYAVTLLYADPEGAAEAYGTQRQRLDEVAATLAERMPAALHDHGAATGRALTRGGLAQTALEALESLT